MLLAGVIIEIATSIDDPTPAMCAILPKGNTNYVLCREGVRGTFVKVTLSKENPGFSVCGIQVSGFPGKLILLV